MSVTQPSLPATDEPAPRCRCEDAEAGLHDGRGPRMARAGLAWTLVRTDFKVRYHGTLSGFAWALLKPAGIFLVLMGVFSFIFPDPAYKLQLIIGLFLWDFFAEGTKTGLASLQAKAFLFKKMRVPLWVLVLDLDRQSPDHAAVCSASSSSSFLTLAGTPPSPSRASRSFRVLRRADASSSWDSRWRRACCSCRYRDLNQVWDVITQAGFFVAPIIYPLGIVPETLPLLLLPVAADADHRILEGGAGVARRAERRQPLYLGLEVRRRACGRACS